MGHHLVQWLCLILGGCRDWITFHPIFPCTIATSPSFAAKERLVHIALGEFEENVRIGCNELIHIQLDPRLHPRHQDGSSGATGGFLGTPWTFTSTPQDDFGIAAGTLHT